MRKLVGGSLLLLALSACSSISTNSTVKAEHRPQIQIVQTSGVAIAARYVDGAIGVRYAVRVGNPSPAQITLRRVTVQSVVEGAYNVNPYSVPFNVDVASQAHQDVQFWVPAVTGLSVTGANGPVTLRVTCEFTSEANGRFQQVVTRVVNHRASAMGD
ncbi:MAG: hypothetical protein M3Q69_11290 [Acidobacteriota bacterium]|nr:hypothetical protein [Acidobacteriota bacterium]